MKAMKAKAMKGMKADDKADKPRGGREKGKGANKRKRGEEDPDQPKKKSPFEAAREGSAYEKAETTKYDSDEELEGKVTRAMRYVFKSFFAELVSLADKQKWAEIKKSERPGKRKEQNELILKYVDPTTDYKAKFKPDMIKATKVTHKAFTNRNEEEEKGIGRQYMLHSVFNGNEAAMRSCELADEIWEENGRMFTATKTRIKRHDDGTRVQGKVTFLPTTVREMSNILNEMCKELDDNKGMPKQFELANRSMSGGAAKKPPTDIDMLMLQDRWTSDPCG